MTRPSGKFRSTSIAALIGAATLASLAVMPKLVPPMRGMIGRPAPNFTASVAANGKVGSQVTLSDLKGKAVLLDFWASWCGPCSMVAPTVDSVARRYEKKGLVVMGVNGDDTPELVRAYAAKKKLGYPMLVDDTRKAFASYGVATLPSLVIIDREGNVRSFFTGVIDEAALSEAVGEAL